MQQIDASLLKSEEAVILELRSLYRKYGYACFKMNQFEEYDLYSKNKDFLISDSVITFNDTNGRLMALKPDVTLSIVNHYKAAPGVQRVYYNENVYRVSDRSGGYREIMQAGLECLGQITTYHLLEAVSLAAASLQTISPRCVLNVSHLGVLSALLAELPAEIDQKALLTCIGEKNAHGIRELSRRCGLTAAQTALLTALTEGYGAPDDVIPRIRRLTSQSAVCAALDQLAVIVRQAQAATGAVIRVDLSLTGDMRYYNGLIFQGFVEGVPSSVLRGGQYDQLMRRMGKGAKAVGFAVYLDLLERLNQKPPYDADVLLLYQPSDDLRAVQQRVMQLIAEGKSVSAQTAVPEKLLCREIETLRPQDLGGQEA